MGKNIEYNMVDLGLPSGLKWADRNVGAVNAHDYGDYFMWGSTESDTDNVCDWAHAPFNGGSSEFDEEYFNAHKSEWLTDEDALKSEYDAASVNMGDGWRMPTKVEMNELISCTNHETSVVEGVSGMFFTNKSDATKKIFMPFSGIRDGSGNNFTDREGCVLSSSISVVDAYYAHRIYFASKGYAFVFNDSWRCFGCAVRGVHE